MGVGYICDIKRGLLWVIFAGRVRKSIKISRIGFGVPFGGELEYLDQQTLLHAFDARTDV
jgi:recombinational DNA repair protein RecR